MENRCRWSIVVALGSALLAGCGDDGDGAAYGRALVVVSPHPDDESILGGGTIHRVASEPSSFVRAVYVSAGDRATVPGDCGDLPEDRKTELIVELRESETHASWHVLAPGREVPIDFLRGPDQGLVASSTMVGGVHADVLAPAGEAVLRQAVEIAKNVPDSVEEALFLSTSIYDAHPDHRVAYHAAREAAASLAAERGITVRLWTWIVHDEVPVLEVSRCCAGDFHWPAPGTRNDHGALTDVSERPRPPVWGRVEDVADLVGVRRDALEAHASQLFGNPELCMPVYVPSFYERWLEKVEEPFYEEVFS